MKPAYLILPAADRDMNGHADHLARHAGPEITLRFFDSTEATCSEIARRPGLGEAYPSTKPRLAGLRVLPVTGFPNHPIDYRVVGENVEIVRWLHGARDQGQALG